MIQLTNNDVKNNGGFLSALHFRCTSYLHNILPPIDFTGIEKYLRHHIVHTDPHLDEYFAELLFHTALPDKINRVEFIEESLYSSTNDFGAKLLWPNSIVFGIGSTVSYGVQPLLLFDEHLTGKGKTLPSCSEVVLDYLENEGKISIAQSIKTLLKEVSAIDEFGNAHPQHLGNLIKTLHNVRFLFNKGVTQKDDIRDFLSHSWKRTLIDTSITSVIYALENNIDLVGDPSSKKEALKNTLDHYVINTPHKTHPKFEQARQTISSNYGNQNGVFTDAVLKGSGGSILKDSLGNPIPQLLLLSRICFASFYAWGEEITNLLMMHFWETEFQKQLNFISFSEELEKVLLNKKDADTRTPVGVIRVQILPHIEIEKHINNYQTRQQKIIKLRKPLIVLNIVPRGDIFNAHQPALNYLNSNNDGCGIIFLEDPFLGTKTLFRASNFPNDKWSKLINLIKSIEPNCWYDPSTDPSRPAPFINNGNKAHQYVQRSGLDLLSLCELIKNVIK